MQLTKKLSELSAMKAKVLQVEANISAERNKALRSLHTEFGYTSAEELIEAIKAANQKPRAKPGPKPKGAKPGPKLKTVVAAAAPKAEIAKKPSKGPRGKVTPELEDRLRALVKAKKTGSEICKELGISEPTLYKAKKKLGLIKASKK